MAGQSEPDTPNKWFCQLYPDQFEKFGSPFLELREGGNIFCADINTDFFAGVLGGRKDLKHHTIYFEPDMQFYFKDWDNIYKPTTSEKLANLYRALLIRSAQEMPSNVHKLNLFHEFRTDKVAKAVVQRAKSVLAADSSFFSPTSLHTRIRGVEILERVARVFVDDLLTKETGTILKLQDAFTIFRGLLKQRNLPDIKRSDFKAVVGPLIREEFDVALRNDLPADGLTGVRGWKGLKLIQTVPS
jgi:hypothetical protein